MSEQTARDTTILSRLDNSRILFHNRFYDGQWSPISTDELRKCQEKSKSDIPNGCELDRDGLYRKEGRMWIPGQLTERILVHNHVAQRHGNAGNEIDVLTKNYLLSTPIHWVGSFDVSKRKDLVKVVDSLRQKCLHCRRTPQLIRRPMHLTQIAKRTRDICT